MSKKNEVPVAVVDIMTADPTTLTREQLSERYKNNIAERKRLAEENQYLITLHKNAASSEKKATAEAKIAALQAKLEALQNPTPVADEPEVAASPDPIAIEG
ncbi:MAG: hypothetical protein LBD41_03190 [Clostridiales Family XIII bacterium]|jgi:ubiquinone biosynthesis protein UbiJ|nr:hypothetical protein [Clostridiales Family XIII bacterium]